MQPNKNVDSLNYSNEKTDVKPEKGFSLKQKIGALGTLFLGAGLFVGAQGMLSPEKSPSHNTPTTEEAFVVHASTAVEIPDADKLAAEQANELVTPLTESYVTATHSVEVPSTTTDPVPDVAPVDTSTTSEHPSKPVNVDTSTTSGNYVEKN